MKRTVLAMLCLSLGVSAGASQPIKGDAPSTLTGRILMLGHDGYAHKPKITLYPALILDTPVDVDTRERGLVSSNVVQLVGLENSDFPLIRSGRVKVECGLIFPNETSGHFEKLLCGVERIRPADR